MTLDGKIASYSGDSKWITGDDARNYVHQLRNVYDGILVGIGTVLKDDPMLNTRLEADNIRNPIRILIDGDLKLPPESNIGKTANRQRTLVFCSERADLTKRLKLESLGIEIHSLNCDTDLIPLEDVFAILGQMEICSLLVEGGGQINGYLLAHRLIDKVYWFVAPKIIGGSLAPSPIGGQGIENMRDALMLTSVDLMRFADDILITGYIKEWFK
jgi:diaminohydroxyphosphoribosylaminopyrimidine deaminase/5-amino-6-(5-phosphoribosylamino)uracil reductase